MAKQFINQLKEGDLINSHFKVNKKKLVDFKTKPGQYLHLLLSDKTGDIVAKVWEDVESYASTFEEDDVIHLKGKVEDYQGNLQLVVSSLRKRLEEEIDWGDFLPRSEKDQEEMLQQIWSAIGEITNVYLKRLLESFFQDSELVRLFSQAPASKELHHCYLGGLLEHTVAVISLCKATYELHPQLDRDLLLTSAILHDIGKIKELKCDRSIDYTDEGRLIGHIVMGERMVSDRTEAIPGFPEQLKMKLRHIILSHHGAYEWGAPKLPMILEACALHYAENLDAQVQRFVQIIEKQPGKPWTEYDRLLERYIYIGSPETELSVEEEVTEPPQPGSLFEQ